MKHFMLCLLYFHYTVLGKTYLIYYSIQSDFFILLLWNLLQQIVAAPLYDIEHNTNIKYVNVIEKNEKKENKTTYLTGMLRQIANKLNSNIV